MQGEKVYCDPCRGETYKESGVPLKASGVSPCTPVGAAVTRREAEGNLDILFECLKFDQRWPSPEVGLRGSPYCCRSPPTEEDPGGTGAPGVGTKNPKGHPTRKKKTEKC